jgi:ribonuclease P/MRP protein subunit POP1
MDVYRTEKIIRMQSAAVVAENAAMAANGHAGTPTGSNPTPSKLSTAKEVPLPQGIYQTPAATYDNGKIYLKGNPLKLLKENWCGHCRKPRLMFPITGQGARLPEDLTRQYCNYAPFIQKPGFDIYGNPFPVDQSGKTKKEREAIRKLERQEKDNTPGSADTGNDNGDAGDPNFKKLLAGGKPASYIPWHTCPNCKRSLLITKFAQHLEKCMRIGGRPARNAAAARLSAANGSTNGSVAGSRVGTPTPSQSGKRDADDDDDIGAPPKKKIKKMMQMQKKNGNGNKASPKSDDKNQKVTIKFKSKSKGDGKDGISLAQRLADDNADGRRDSVGSSKRGRDDDDDEQETPKPKSKKLKLSIGAGQKDDGRNSVLSEIEVESPSGSP